MVNSINFKNNPIKIIPLKSRLNDFKRVNPSTRLKNSFKPERIKVIPSNNLYNSSIFIINWAKTRFTDNNLHIGITVSKKSISKLAVKRNLIKRKLRAGINENIRNYNLIGYDFVITARNKINETSYNDLVIELNKAFHFIENKIAICDEIKLQ